MSQNTTPLLSARGIKISFGGVIAADGIDLDIFPGEMLAIIGPNGAGKTTFLNVCTGYLKPQAGSVRMGGAELLGMAPRAITRLGVARAFQIPQLFVEHTVLENMLLSAAVRERAWNPFRNLHALPQRDEMMELLRLVDCADIAERSAHELPEGQRKLVDIAIALAQRPKLLLMDEPTSGVASSDKFGIMEILIDALRKAQVTSVFVEHDMEMVTRYASRVAVWSEGRIQMQGEPAHVMNDPEVIRTVIGG